jgi:hypothetical protein
MVMVVGMKDAGMEDLIEDDGARLEAVAVTT